MTQIAAVVSQDEFVAALKELEDLKFAKKQRDYIYDFMARRGFEVPGMMHTVVEQEFISADERAKRAEERATHLGNQINELSHFLAKRGWNLDHGGGAVDIAIGVIKQLDDQLLNQRVTQNGVEFPEDYGQELERQYPSPRVLTCEDVGCPCVNDNPVEAECADCRSGCYNCAKHGGGV